MLACQIFSGTGMKMMLTLELESLVSQCGPCFADCVVPGTEGGDQSDEQKFYFKRNKQHDHCGERGCGGGGGRRTIRPN